VKTVSDKVVWHAFMPAIGSPLRAFQCASVRRLAVAKRSCDCSYSVFARSASAVTASEKSSVNTTRKSTTRFPMSLRWIVSRVSEKPGRRQRQFQETVKDVSVCNVLLMHIAH